MPLRLANTHSKKNTNNNTRDKMTKLQQLTSTLLHISIVMHEIKVSFIEYCEF